MCFGPVGTKAHRCASNAVHSFMCYLPKSPQAVRVVFLFVSVLYLCFSYCLFPCAVFHLFSFQRFHRIVLFRMLSSICYPPSAFTFLCYHLLFLFCLPLSSPFIVNLSRPPVIHCVVLYILPFLVSLPRLLSSSSFLGFLRRPPSSSSFLVFLPWLPSPFSFLVFLPRLPS